MTSHQKRGPGRVSKVISNSVTFFGKFRKSKGQVHHHDTSPAKVFLDVPPAHVKPWPHYVRRLILIRRAFRPPAVRNDHVKDAVLHSRFGKPTTEYEKDILENIFMSTPLMLKIAQVLADMQRRATSIVFDAAVPGDNVGSWSLSSRNFFREPKKGSQNHRGSRTSVIGKIKKTIMGGRNTTHRRSSCVTGIPDMRSRDDGKFSDTDSDCSMHSIFSGDHTPALSICGVGRNRSSNHASANSSKRATVSRVRSPQEEGVQHVVGLLCEAIHIAKVCTIQVCTHDVVLPMKEALREANMKYDLLWKQFAGARTSYLKELSALRDRLRDRPDPRMSITSKDSHKSFFFDAKDCLRFDEAEFVVNVVKEEMKIMFDADSKWKSKVDVAEIERLMEFTANLEVEKLQRQLEVANSEIYALRKAIAPGSQPAATASTGKAKKGMVDFLEEQVKDLRKEDSRRQSLIVNLKNDLRQSEDNFEDFKKRYDAMCKELEELKSEHKNMKSENKKMEQELSDVLHKVDDLEHSKDDLESGIMNKNMIHFSDMAKRRASKVWGRVKPVRPADKIDVYLGAAEKQVERLDEGTAMYICDLESECQRLREKLKVQANPRTSIGSVRLSLASCASMDSAVSCALPDLLQEFNSVSVDAGSMKVHSTSGGVLSAASSVEEVEAEVEHLRGMEDALFKSASAGDAVEDETSTQAMAVKRRLQVAECLYLTKRAQVMSQTWKRPEKNEKRGSATTRSRINTCHCGATKELQAQEQTSQQQKKIIIELVAALQKATLAAEHMQNTVFTFRSQVQEVAASLRGSMLGPCETGDQADQLQSVIVQLDSMEKNVFSRLWDDAIKRVRSKFKPTGEEQYESEGPKQGYDRIWEMLEDASDMPITVEDKKPQTNSIVPRPKGKIVPTVKTPLGFGMRNSDESTDSALNLTGCSFGPAPKAKAKGKPKAPASRCGTPGLSESSRNRKGVNENHRMGGGKSFFSFGGSKVIS
mmetsp:Transcript_31919/g.58486  ORF Transcript_31919/g.58486 Transcript_31919/m.58486 type:complete len:987 (+) Transcript_31919:125-3085(+)